MELKAKNISKKVTKPPKTVSLSVSTGFPLRDSLYLVAQRSLTMSNIYLFEAEFHYYSNPAHYSDARRSLS